MTAIHVYEKARPTVRPEKFEIAPQLIEDDGHVEFALRVTATCRKDEVLRLIEELLGRTWPEDWKAFISGVWLCTNADGKLIGGRGVVELVYRHRQPPEIYE